MEIGSIPRSDALFPVSLNGIQGKVPTAVNGIRSVFNWRLFYPAYLPGRFFYPPFLWPGRSVLEARGSELLIAPLEHPIKEIRTIPDRMSLAFG